MKPSDKTAFRRASKHCDTILEEYRTEDFPDDLAEKAGRCFERLRLLGEAPDDEDLATFVVASLDRLGEELAARGVRRYPGGHDNPEYKALYLEAQQKRSKWRAESDEPYAQALRYKDAQFGAVKLEELTALQESDPYRWEIILGLMKMLTEQSKVLEKDHGHEVAARVFRTLVDGIVRWFRAAGLQWTGSAPVTPVLM